MIGLARPARARSWQIATALTAVRQAFRTDKVCVGSTLGSEVLQLSPAEAEIVRRLEIAVRWAGRYPVPLDADEMLGTGTITPMPRSSRHFMNAFSNTPPDPGVGSSAPWTDRLGRLLLVTLEATRVNAQLPAGVD